MIQLTRLNNTKISVNPFLIEMIEETPDTVIMFDSGRKIVVKEKTLEIEKKFIEFLSSAIKLAIDKSKEK